MLLGYSCVWIAIEGSEDLVEIQVGDRVACAGGGHASHAEIVSVPRNLVAKVPEHVGREDAPYTHSVQLLCTDCAWPRCSSVRVWRL